MIDVLGTTAPSEPDARRSSNRWSKAKRAAAWLTAMLIQQLLAK